MSDIKCYKILSNLMEGPDHYITYVAAHNPDEAIEIWLGLTHYRTCGSIQEIDRPTILSSEPYRY